MKKILTSLALLGLFAAGCTNADDVLGNNADNSAAGGDETTNYIAISIATPRGASSRADIAGEYVTGTEDENAVHSIRFYFFDKDKQAALVRKNPDKAAEKKPVVYDSFYDYEILGNEEGEGDEDATIAKTLTVSLTLNLPYGSKPKYVVAILNPTDAARIDNPSLAELEAAAADFLPVEIEVDGQKSKSFIMSNSVYSAVPPADDEEEDDDDAAATDDDDAAGQLQKINYTKITGLYKTMEEALESVDNRTVIYVERVAARLDLNIDKTAASKLKPASDDERYTGSDKENVFYTGKDYLLYNDVEANKQPIFVKFLAWTVTSTPDKSNLLKDIKPDWPNTLFGTEGGGTAREPWNVADYYRSFWAMNPTLTNANNSTTTSAQEGEDKPSTNYKFFSYDEILSANTSFGETDEDNVEQPARVYIPENAAEIGKDAVLKNHETKVIVAAKLVKANGDDMPIAEYGGKYYEKSALLESIANQLSLHLHTDPENPDDTKLTVDDIEFKTQAAYKNDAGVEVPGGYFSYVALSEQGENKTWYLNDGTTEYEDVNGYIEDHMDNTHVLIWDGGKTYYYFTVRHLGAGTDETPGAGYYGVVRNHVYAATITGIPGIGTPVLDSGEKIYPEKPEREGNVLAAEIDILQWRVVGQKYDFSW